MGGPVVFAPAKRMLTSQEAAEYCGFKSVEGFEAHIQVAPVKFGKFVRYDVRDLDDYLDRFRQSPASGNIAELVGGFGEGRGR